MKWYKAAEISAAYWRHFKLLCLRIYSWAEEEKFRVIFVVEELLEDQLVKNMLLQMIQAIFPECDHSCKNMDRMLFGGRGLIYFDEEARMALVQLLHPRVYCKFHWCEV